MPGPRLGPAAGSGWALAAQDQQWPFGQGPRTRGEGRPCPARPLRARLSVSAEKAGHHEGLLKVPQRGGLCLLSRSQPFTCSQSWLLHPRCLRPSSAPEGQLRLPHGNAGLGSTPEHSIRKGLGCCLLPPARPWSSISLHPLTRPPQPSRLSGRPGQVRTRAQSQRGTVWVSAPHLGDG